MRIALVSLFPDMFDAVGDHGVVGRAVEQGLVKTGAAGSDRLGNLRAWKAERQ